MEIAKVDVWRKSVDCRHFNGSSGARIIIGDDQDALFQLWAERRGLVREDRSGFVVGFGSSTEDFTPRGYDAVTGRMPIAWSVITLCYATAVILLAPWPWNFLLLLLLLLLLFSSSKHLRHGGFDKVPARDVVPGTRSWR